MPPGRWHQTAPVPHSCARHSPRGRCTGVAGPSLRQGVYSPPTVQTPCIREACERSMARGVRVLHQRGLCTQQTHARLPVWCMQSTAQMLLLVPRPCLAEEQLGWNSKTGATVVGWKLGWGVQHPHRRQCARCRRGGWTGAQVMGEESSEELAVYFGVWGGHAGSDQLCNLTPHPTCTC